MGEAKREDVEMDNEAGANVRARRGRGALSRRGLVVLACAGLMATTVPAAAQTPEGPPAASAILLNETMDASQLQEVGTATNDSQEAFMEEYLREAASEGALVDAQGVNILEAPSGMVIAVPEEVAVSSATHRIQQFVGHDEEGNAHDLFEERLGVSTTPADEVATDDAESISELPLGPGSAALTDLTGNVCTLAQASYNRKNTMAWCYKKHQVTGGDGSSSEDYFSYMRWATMQPDKSPINDYYVVQGHVFSWPTSNTITHRQSKLLAWTPTSASCGTTASFSAGFGTLSWGVPACSSGTDISFTALDGRFKHRYSCVVCSYGQTRDVGFHIGVSVKQATVPYWNDDNYAVFRQDFNPNSAIVDN